MTSVRAGVRIVGACVLTFSWLHAANSKDSVSLYNQRTHDLAAQSVQNWQRGAVAARSQGGPVAVHSGGGTKARAAEREAALRGYLSSLVPEMKPSAKVAHIPKEFPVKVDEQDPEKKWTKYYDKAKNSLRANVEYEWNSNAVRTPQVITLTEEHVATLRANFDILMWYRNELDRKSDADNQRGAKRFKLFLDYFVADLLEGLPEKPTIDLKTGKVEGDRWKLDEQNLREQLIMAYRYLVAKHQVYEEYDQFGPADRELLVSMMKIAFLVGAHMNPEWFDEMDVNLNQVSDRSKWKRPIADALEVLQDEQFDTADYEEPFVIAIPPPKPKPKPAPPKPEPVQDGQKVEIIIRSKP